MAPACKVMRRGNRVPECLSNPRWANFGAAHESFTATDFQLIPSHSVCSSWCGQANGPRRCSHCLSPSCGLLHKTIHKPQQAHGNTDGTDNKRYGNQVRQHESCTSIVCLPDGCYLSPVLGQLEEFPASAFWHQHQAIDTPNCSGQ